MAIRVSRYGWQATIAPAEVKSLRLALRFERAISESGEAIGRPAAPRRGLGICSRRGFVQNRSVNDVPTSRGRPTSACLLPTGDSQKPPT